MTAPLETNAQPQEPGAQVAAPAAPAPSSPTPAPSSPTNSPSSSAPGARPAPAQTEAQRRAIEAEGVSVCVSAGAGSGKTFVLVERFLKLVRTGTGRAPSAQDLDVATAGGVADAVAPSGAGEAPSVPDPVDPREILTITFTEKAAAEMRERIAKAFAAPEHRRQRAALEGAWISTIHGFCARLLRVYSVEADVDPAFAVLTDLPLARVRRAAFAEAQASFRRERPDDYLALVDRVRWGRDEDGLAGIDRRVFSLHDALRAAGAKPRALESGAPPPSLDALDRSAVEPARARARLAFQAYQLAVNSNPKSTPLARERLSDVSAGLAPLGALLDGPFSPEIDRTLRSILKSLSRGGQYKEERQELGEALEALAAACVEGPARAVGAALDDLVARFDASFRARKAQLAALDFSDLEERARDLLTSRADVREDVQRRFRSVLVDEFQDTSRLQQKIVDLVRPRDAFFAVGDVKQAIYGFRHAEVRGLLEVEAEVAATGGLVVPLDASFRTRPSVLAYVDAVFERVFGEEGSEVRHQPLRSAESVAFAEKAEPSVEILISSADRLEQGRKGEARALAGRIAAIVEGKLLQGTNPLRADSFGKPLRYRDCAILFRAMTELPTYERALRERGVPYRVARGGGFFEAAEIVDAIALLRAVASERDDLALATVLRSPAFGLTDDALAGLRELAQGEASAANGPRDGWLGRALARAPDARGLSAGERERAQALGAALEKLRLLRGRETPRVLVERAFELTGVGEATLVRLGTPRGLANLHKLLEIVDELAFDEGTGASLGFEDVVAALEDLRASGSREAEASLSGGDEDAVLLLSVHAAKGLEWPLVVVADLGRGENPFGDPVVWSEATGSVPILKDPEDPQARLEPTSYGRLVAERKAREREESKRLLYVAMTRCRDHLILAGARGGSRAAGAWLAWSLAPLDLGLPPIAVEKDEVLGATARTIPGPDPTGIRVVQIGESSLSDAPLRDLEGDPATSSAGPSAGEPGRGPGGGGLRGPLGPESGARTLLDAQVRDRIRQGLPPGFLVEQGGLPGEAIAEAREVLARVEAPLAESDLGASAYVVTEVLAWEACPRQYLYEHVLGARGETFASRERPGLRALGDGLFGDAGSPGAVFRGGPGEGVVEEDSRLSSEPEGADSTEAADAARAREALRVDDPDVLPRNRLGTAAHRVLELGPARTRDLARKIVLEEVGALLTKPGVSRTTDRLLEWADAFDRSPLGRRAAAARAVHREEPFLVRVALGAGSTAGDSVLLRGTADLVFVEGEGPVLVDYKTNDLTPLEVPLKVPAYALQLQLYAVALAPWLGRAPREAWLSFLAAGQSVSVDVSPAALESARARLARFAAARRRGEFEPRVGSLCRTCAFRQVCPAEGK